MRRKLIGLMVLMLLTGSAMQITGFSGEKDDTEEYSNDSFMVPENDKDLQEQPPPPGDLRDDAPSFNVTYESIHSSVNRSTFTVSGNIEELIQQIDEDLVSGYIQDLVDFGPRVTGTTACEDAAEYIYNQFENMGLSVRYHYWNNNGLEGINVEATLEGQDPTSDWIFIVCGHYDSVSGSPGADDNAAGTAAVLAAAKVMSQYSFNHTVRFVTFSGEEQGLIGSNYYVQEAYNNGDNIIAALNADMIGYAETDEDKNSIKIYSNSESEWIMTFTEDVSQTYDELISLSIIDMGSSSNSDHYRFWQYGYDAIMYHEYHFNPYYHSSQDTVDKIDMNYDMRVSRLIMATLAELAQPLINKPFPPEKPSGTRVGAPTSTFTFLTTTVDPNGDQVYYKWSWGGGEDTWIGPYPSGETVEVNHTWNSPGDRLVRVKAKDDKGYESDWSKPLLVHVTWPPNPPEKPSGPENGWIEKTYSFSTQTIDPDGYVVYYQWSWDDGSYSEWIGDYPSGETIVINHTWNETGVYKVQVKAKDIYGLNSSWSESLTIQITEKPAPHQPYGPSSIDAGVEAVFCTEMKTSDADELYCWWDWGDSSNSGWLGPYETNEQLCASHVWNKAGDYKIKVKIKDNEGVESNWSKPLQVHVKGPKLEITLTSGLGVKATIKNTGDKDAADVTWSIQVEGGILDNINLSANDVITTLAAGDEIRVETKKHVIGVGQIKIKVTATAPYTDPAIKNTDGLIIGFIVILR
ncbi:MAG TPA: M20/M25/M40 family metallo-hydrolase [Thermoplasmatales archaeon]|nr:M20/M25/M40 family metallo-hydrolase [Thermoplasmatales archaeon]